MSVTETGSSAAELQAELEDLQRQLAAAIAAKEQDAVQQRAVDEFDFARKYKPREGGA
jgi:hypothetical protein